MLGDEWEIMLHLSDITEDDYEDDIQTFDNLAEKYGLNDYDLFCNLVKDLANMIDVGKSPLTETRYKGFAHNEMFLYRIEIDNK